MSKKRHSAEEIIQHLRIAEIEESKATNQAEADRKFRVTPVTLPSCKSEFGDLRVDQAKRRKELEAENQRLKRWARIVIGRIRFTRRYVVIPNQKREKLEARTVDLATQYGRFSYVSITDLLR